MKLFTLALASVALFLVNQNNESGNNIEPADQGSLKNNRIINTYKHPYYERYINYLDIPNISYTNSQNLQNAEGC